MAKRLVVCFDGTWNTPDEDSRGPVKDFPTNVSRIYRSILGRDTCGLAGGTPKKQPQVTTVKWYDSGVGTAWYEHIRGGAFGFGLSQNIRQGYKFLIENYEPGDEVYLFGFSRGAYTARSLVGLLRNSGLLDLAKLLVPDARYPAWKVTSPGRFRALQADDVPHILDAYQLYRNRDGGPDTPFAVDFRSRYAHPDVRIAFLGVWDTVGALGIPLKVADKFNAAHYAFHDTELSGIVRWACQAVALDEHREDYQATLWAPKQKPSQKLEQVWFAGAHADVGGGYEDPTLADAALAWMQARARDAGLELAGLQAVDEGRVARTPPTDSFGDFLLGVYKLFKDRHFRPVGQTQFGAEALHPTVVVRPDYAPKNPGFRDLVARQG